MTSVSIYARILAAVLSAIVGGASAAAEEQSVAGEQAAEVHLDEIVVTAAKRGNADIQSVPIAISAYTGQQLQSMGIESFNAIDLKTPGLVFTQDSGTVQPYIRGIGANFPTPGLEPPVSGYVDDVYWQRATSSNYDLVDINSLEVLKGPQGTLYGRNATGGAILLNTNNPTNKDEGSITVEGGNLGHERYDLILNLALTDRLAARIAARYSDQDGYVDNPVTGTDYGGYRDTTVRGKISYTGDGFTVLWSTGYSQSANRSGIRQAVLGAPLCVVCATTGATPPPGSYETYQGQPNPITSHVADTNIKVTADIGQLTFTSISAARSAFDQAATDEGAFAGAPPPHALDIEIFNENVDRGTDLLQEFRLASHFTGPLNFLAGLNGQYSVEDFGSILTGSAFEADPNQELSTFSKLYTYSVSPYGEIYYDLTSNLKLTAGARYNSDRKDAGTTVEGGLFGPEYFYHYHATNTTPRVVLEYSPDDLENYYISYNTGYKSGGFNLPSFAQSSTDILKPETIKSYEIGAKNKFLDRRIQTTAAMFYYDYKDIQVGYVDPVRGSIKQNAGAAQAYGVELDAQFAATEQVTLGAGYSFLHARFTSYPNASVYEPSPTGVGLATTTVNLDGAPLTRAPDHTAYVSGTYKFPLPIAADWKGSVTGIARYTSAYDFNPDAGGTLGLDRQRAYALANLSGFVGPSSERYKIGFYVNNLFNKLYYEQVDTSALGAYRGPAAPRTYGGNITFKF